MEHAPPHTDAEAEQLGTQRWELLEHFNDITETPLVALSFVWLGLLVVDFISGLNPLLQLASNIIWLLFVLDFLIEFVIAPRKLQYLRRNWLAAISLLLPALRVFRLARALRVLRAARTVRSLSLVRLLTSLNRGMGAVRYTMGRRGIGFVIVLTIIVIFAGAAGMLLFESPRALAEAGYAAEPRAGLAGYSEAIWWTAMIITTMGSEYWPQTAEGRILSWLLAVYASTVFGYITATIASHFIGQDQAEAASAPQLPPAELAALREEIAALRAQLSGMPAPPAPRGQPDDPAQG